MQENKKDHLDGIIKSSFEKRSQGAPDALWVKLSSALDGDAAHPAQEVLPADALHDKVKESFFSLNKKAPGHIWPAINRQLNIDKVWQGISDELDKSRPLYWPGMRVAAAILLLLVSGAGAFLLYNNQNSDIQQVSALERMQSQPSVTTSEHDSQALLAAEDELKQQQATSLVKIESADKTFGTSSKSLDAHGPASTSPEDPAPNSLASASSLPARHPALLPVESSELNVGTVQSGLPVEQVGQLASVSENAASAGQASTANTKDESLPLVATAGKVPASEENVAQAGASTAADMLTAASAANAAFTKSETAIEVGASPSQVHIPSQTALAATDKPAGELPLAPAADAPSLAGMMQKDSAAQQQPVADESTPQPAAALAQNTGSVPADVASVPSALSLQEGKPVASVVGLEASEKEPALFASLQEEAVVKAASHSRYDAGLVMVYHNSWLLNNETKNSYDKNTLISTDPTYKLNWGVVLNYYISKKSILATEVHIVSRVGQQYKLYQQGEYLEKGLELRYYKAYLQYQYNFLSWGKKVPSRLTAKTGAYVGYLDSKRGEIRPQETSRYDHLDYGLRLAMGQETSLGNFVIGYGLSAERGLNNVFRGTEKLPSEFNKTYILNFGTYLNLRYAF